MFKYGYSISGIISYEGKNRRFNGDYKDAAILISSPLTNELKNNSEINIEKADKGTTTAILDKQDKVEEAGAGLTR